MFTRSVYTRRHGTAGRSRAQAAFEVAAHREEPFAADGDVIELANVDPPRLIEGRKKGSVLHQHILVRPCVERTRREAADIEIHRLLR